MKEKDVSQTYAMPISSPAFPKGPYRFYDREFLVITYRTDEKKLREAIPEPLEFVEPLVKFEFIRMPNSTGFGDYTESGQIIPVQYKGHKGGFSHAMYLNDGPPILGGRELWGFPKKYAEPALAVHRDTLVGSLDYGPVRIATGTMGFKHSEADSKAVIASLNEPNYLVKVVPNPDGTPGVCQLVRYQIEDIDLKGAWTGPAALELHAHALAPVANLPVLEIVSATHLVADLTLGLGVVEHDYLGGSATTSRLHAAE